MALRNPDRLSASAAATSSLEMDPMQSGLVYSDRDMADLLKIELQKKKRKKPSPSDRGMIIFDPGFSLQYLEELPEIEHILHIYDRIRDDLFATTTRTAGYRKVCIPAVDTDDLPFRDQEKVIRNFQEDACATTVAALAWVTHKLATGQSLYPDGYIRCSEKKGETTRNIEMFSTDHMLYISYGWDALDSIDEGRGLASMKT